MVLDSCCFLLLFKVLFPLNMELIQNILIIIIRRSNILFPVFWYNCSVPPQVSRPLSAVFPPAFGLRCAISNCVLPYLPGFFIWSGPQWSFPACFQPILISSDFFLCLYIASLDLFPEVQTHISYWLLSVFLWMFNKHLKVKVTKFVS